MIAEEDNDQIVENNMNAPLGRLNKDYEEIKLEL
jgi:hypothetical protein